MDMPPCIVDTHAHVYCADVGSFPPIDDPWDPGEPAQASDLRRKMVASGVSRAVLIQTGTYYGFDNRYILAASKANAEWAVGVVTLDPDDPTSVSMLRDAVRHVSTCITTPT